MRVWANAWDVFRRTPSRGGRGRRAAVDFVEGFRCGGVYFLCFLVFWFFVFFFERTRPAASMRTPCLIYLSTSNEAVFAVRAKKPTSIHTGVRTGCHCLISLSICVCDIRLVYGLRELWEADFHKPGIYGSG